MSGPSIVWTKVKTNAGVLAVVGVDDIMCGTLPVGTPMPAIGITQIGKAQRLNLSMVATKWLMRARVTVTVLSKDYEQANDVLELVRLALPNFRGIVSGYEVESILPDVEGPDEENPDEGIKARSADYIVTFQGSSA